MYYRSGNPPAQKVAKIERINMRIVHLAGTIALLALLLCRLDGASAQGSDAARQACTPDAMRLARVTACMKAKYRQLSQPCRVAMRGTPSRAGRHHGHYHHYRRCHHCG
jgi:hypothetical protein